MFTTCRRSSPSTARTSAAQSYALGFPPQYAARRSAYSVPSGFAPACGSIGLLAVTAFQGTAMDDASVRISALSESPVHLPVQALVFVGPKSANTYEGGERSE